MVAQQDNVTTSLDEKFQAQVLLHGLIILTSSGFL